MSASRNLPGIAALATAMVFAYTMLPAQSPEGEFDLVTFSQLPVQVGGRVKPLDTLSRVNLTLVSSSQDYKEFDDWEQYLVDKKAKRQPAVKWLLDTLAYNEVMNVLTEGHTAPRSFGHHVIRIENQEVLTFFFGDFKHRPSFMRYSINELRPKLDEFFEEAHRAQDITPRDRTLFQAKMFELGMKFEIVMSLLTVDKAKKPELIPNLLPPEKVDGDWRTFAEGMAEAFRNRDKFLADRTSPAKSWLAMFVHYREGKAEKFNEELHKYVSYLAEKRPDDLKWARWETLLNRADPFFTCMVAYGLIFLLACLSWVAWGEPLRRTAFLSMIVVASVHVFFLGLRCFIQGRPPVTNLYSSAVFIGVTAVLTSLFVEVFFRNAMAVASGSVVGLLSLIVARFLSESGDTMEMMQAVLDTNFWLATHVTTVTFGYTAMFLAGFMGVAYVILGVFTPGLSGGRAQALSKAIYGTLCFAMLLSFVGTVLGGIWADQSWGRFWGWDPKENGALLIVIWCALMLHARWSGMAKARGIAQMAIFGNVITAWSWFGTNMLGVGLHSYGFMPAAMFWLLVFVGVQMSVLVVGWAPLSWWYSFAVDARIAAAAARIANPVLTPGSRPMHVEPSIGRQ